MTRILATAACFTLCACAAVHAGSAIHDAGGSGDACAFPAREPPPEARLLVDAPDVGHDAGSLTHVNADGCTVRPIAGGYCEGGCWGTCTGKCTAYANDEKGNLQCAAFCDDRCLGRCIVCP